MTNKPQAGSVLGYLLIATLLTILLIGGIYFVRNNIAKNAQVAVPQIAKKDDTKQTTLQKTPQTTDDTAKKAAEEQEAKAEVQRKALAEEQARNQAATDSNASSTVSQTSPVAPGSSTDNATPAQSLPQTGSSDTLLSALALSSMTSAALMYRRSQRALI